MVRDGRAVIHSVISRKVFHHHHHYKIIITFCFDLMESLGFHWTASLEYYILNEASGQLTTKLLTIDSWELTTWNKWRKNQARNNPGDDIWLQTWQPSSVLIAMEHSGKTTFTLNNWYHDSKEKWKVILFKRSDAGGKHGWPVQKDWSRQVYGRLLRAAGPSS